MDAIPEVRKWANFGGSSGSYNTSLAGKVTGLTRERRLARYLGGRELMSRFEEWSSMVSNLVLRFYFREKTALLSAGII
jgi:hypothetical protein